MENSCSTKTYLSYAKINLRLDVLNKLNSGYHNIRIISALINLHDVIEIKKNRNGGLRLRVPKSPELENENNLIVKALRLMEKKYGLKCNLDILLKKEIPISAGLGGGSSNAGIIIKSINELYDLSISNSDLISIAREIGSDVPFFIVGKNALVTGTGETIEPIPYLPKLNILIIKPEFGISTAWAYKNLKLTTKNNNASCVCHLRLTSVKDVIEVLSNDLEKPCIDKYPVLNEIKSQLIENGAISAMMSGSGPSVFGIFSDTLGGENEIKRAYEYLKSKYPFVWKGETL